MLVVAVHNPSQHDQILAEFGHALLFSDRQEDIAIASCKPDEGTTCIPIRGNVCDDQLCLEIRLVESGKPATLVNHGAAFELPSGHVIETGESAILDLPFAFRMGESQLRILRQESKPIEAGFEESAGTPRSSTAAHHNWRSPEPETLLAWFSALSDLQKAAAGSQRLFDTAARSLVNPGGLDGGMVLSRTAVRWQIESSYIPYPEHQITFRQSLVEDAAQKGLTCYREIESPSKVDQSSHSAVVCPVFNEHNQVVAALYGIRSCHDQNQRRGIRKLEAQFVQVVADAISSGMLRLNSEAEAARSKVLLEQVFSPKVSSYLQAHPNALEGQQREVTVLFADMRNFTAISEKLGAQATYELLSDVMDQFSEIIRDHDGVIIDFYGDGVSAFWNAPIQQQDHALRACQTGLRMVEAIEMVGRRWRHLIGEELNVGIGIHTGTACVGNSGSRTRLKYGPRGPVVNIASRLENKTKQISIPLLISQSTAKAIASEIPSRRIITTQLDGIVRPVAVYELLDDNWLSLQQREQYQLALTAFESKEFSKARGILDQLSEAFPKDKAVRYLWQRVMAAAQLSPDRNPTELVEEEIALRELSDVADQIAGAAALGTDESMDVQLDSHASDLDCE